MSKFWDIQTDTFDYNKSKSELIQNLDYILGMSVEEQTLYKKWIELNEDLHTSYTNLPAYASHYNTIWKPTDIMDRDLTISEINSINSIIEIVNPPSVNSTFCLIDNQSG